MKQYEPHASSFGRISANLMAILCYILALVFPLPGLIAAGVVSSWEKFSGLVRFSALQAMALGIARLIVANVAGGTGRLAGVYTLWLNGLIFALGVAAAVNAYRWKAWKIVFIGNWAQRKCEKARVAYNGEGPVPPEARQTDAASPQAPQAPQARQESLDEARVQPSIQLNMDEPAKRERRSGRENREDIDRQHMTEAYSDANDQLPEDMRDPPPRF